MNVTASFSNLDHQLRMISYNTEALPQCTSGICFGGLVLFLLSVISSYQTAHLSFTIITHFKGQGWNFSTTAGSLLCHSLLKHSSVWTQSALQLVGCQDVNAEMSSVFYYLYKYPEWCVCVSTSLGNSKMTLSISARQISPYDANTASLILAHLQPTAAAEQPVSNAARPGARCCFVPSSPADPLIQGSKCSRQV